MIDAKGVFQEVCPTLLFWTTRDVKSNLTMSCPVKAWKGHVLPATCRPRARQCTVLYEDLAKEVRQTNQGGKEGRQEEPPVNMEDKDLTACSVTMREKGPKNSAEKSIGESTGTVEQGPGVREDLSDDDMPAEFIDEVKSKDECWDEVRKPVPMTRCMKGTRGSATEDSAAGGGKLKEDTVPANPAEKKKENGTRLQFGPLPPNAGPMNEYQAMEARGKEEHTGTESEEAVLMQRRKRGRSSSPRRRRRQRREEEARRAANRARWTIRGTPSRAPPVGTRTSSTRSFPPAPWSRRPNPEAEEEAVCVEEQDEEAAGSTEAPGRRGARDAAMIPGLDDLDPRIRWWSDIIGLTNPMNSTEGLTVLAPNTTTTIISNLQDQGEVERARTVRSVLSFLGLFIAELLRAIHDAEHGDRVVLMQQTLALGPGSFARILAQLQEDLEKMGKARAKKASEDLLRRLAEMDQARKGMRTKDRILRLTALLVVYDEGEVEVNDVMACDSRYDWEPSWLWARVEPFLRQGQEREGTRASSSSDAAGVFDEDDEAEGILVKRAPGLPWEKPTRDEVKEMKQHDKEVKEEEAIQERADEEAYQRMQASRLQDWEDWAMMSEMSAAPARPTKRVRVVMVLGSEGGQSVAEGVMEGLMDAEASPMVTMTMSHVMLGPGPDQQVVGPPTPETVALPNHQTENQLASADAPVDLDEFLTSEHGRRWFDNWKSGQIDDEMVVARWGNSVLELFIVTKTIEDDPTALDSQKKPTEVGEQKDDVQASDNRRELPLPVGYVEPEGDRVESTQAEQDESQDVMDEENGDLHGDNVMLMQKGAPMDFETLLQKMLAELDNMARIKAARLTSFLRQMLIDQRRHAPHLRHPKLADRHDRLQALLAVFDEEKLVMRDDELKWCHEAWQRISPFMENALLPDGQQPEAAPMPSQASEDVVQVVDSQEQVEEDGSRKQLMQMEDGSQRKRKRSSVKMKCWKNSLLKSSEMRNGSIGMSFMLRTCAHGRTGRQRKGITWKARENEPECKYWFRVRAAASSERKTGCLGWDKVRGSATP